MGVQVLAGQRLPGAGLTECRSSGVVLFTEEPAFQPVTVLCRF